MRGYMREHAIGTTWPVAERLLVSISPSPFSPQVVRAAKRMATALRAEWIVAYVETPGLVHLSEADRARLTDTLRLAEQLGAETVTLSGQRIGEELLAFAQARNVTKIVIGKPKRPLWRRLLFGSIADALVRGSGDIDVHVISGEGSPSTVRPAGDRERRADWRGYGLAGLVFGLCTALAWVMFPYSSSRTSSWRISSGSWWSRRAPGWGRPSWPRSCSVAAFDFFFVPPYYTFAVSDTQYFVTFGVMLLVAVVLSNLAARMRAQAESARLRERRTAALYAMSRELASSRGMRTVLEAAVRHISEVFRCQAVVLLPDGAGQLTRQIGLREQFDRDTTDLGASQWVYEHGQMAGPGTGTLPGATALFLPLTASRGKLGVLGVRPWSRTPWSRPSSSTCWRPLPARPPSPLNERNWPRRRSRRRSGGGGTIAQFTAEFRVPRSPHAARLHHGHDQRSAGR